MTHDLARERQADGEQERRPVNRVLPDDFLADQMHVGRPVFREPGGRRRIRRSVTHGREVIRQGIEPDVHDMRGIVRHRNAPSERGPADTQILESGLQEGHHLVPTNRRNQELRVVLVVVEERLLKRREPEKITLLGDSFDGISTDGTPAILQLRIGNEDLVDRAVPAFVLAFVDESAIPHQPPQRL